MSYSLIFGIVITRNPQSPLAQSAMSKLELLLSSVRESVGL